MAPRVVITGPGRAGTTVLVQVLTDLGADTGFAPETPIDPRARAGLELELTDERAPRVVKNTFLTGGLRQLLAAGGAEIEHVIVPLRRPEISAASRIRVADYGDKIGVPGGLFGTGDARSQELALHRMLHELLTTVADFELPLTLLTFPRWLFDPEYAFSRLGFLTPDRDLEVWRQTLAGRADPDLIHEEPLTVRERWRTWWAARAAVRREAGRPNPWS